MSADEMKSTRAFHGFCAACLVVAMFCFRRWIFGHRILYSFGFATVLFGLVAAIAGIAVHSAEKKGGQFVPWIFVFSFSALIYWIAGAPVSR